MKRERVGKRDQRIRIEERTVTKQANGEETVSWTTLATVWAEVIHVSGREILARYGVDDEQAFRFRIRARDDLDATMRIVFQGRYFDIKGLPLKTREPDMTLTCVEGLSNG